MKKIDTYEKTRNILPPFSAFIRMVSFFARSFEHVKLYKIGKIPKPPYLLISSHASFMDFFNCIKATHPHQPYWISTIEEYIDKDFIFRELGVLPKRKFTNDPRCARMVLEVLKDRKKILIVFPEARYSFVGHPERIDEGLGKLAKAANVPVVFLNNHGHYLRDPQWGDHKIRKIRPMYGEMKCIISKKYVHQLSADEIQNIIEENFKFDEEQYQLDKGIKNTYPNRAEGIERILYKCPHCGKEFEMSSEGSHFKCNSCGAEYLLKEDGTISRVNGESKFTKISDWYYWEKEEIKKEIIEGKYRFEDEVRVEELVGTGVGFVPMKGKYNLTHTIDGGFELIGENGFTYKRSPLQSYAIHIEFDYKKKGGCIDLATNTDTYFVYPLNKSKELTKIHFANEIIYYLHKQNLK